MVPPYKCVVWSPLRLFSRFLPPSGFCIPVEGIRVLGVPSRSFSFVFFFLLEALNDDVQHVDVLLKLGDV
jgi:hypothetical protein